MKVEDLKRQIKDLPDDMEVFIRCHIKSTGNIIEAGRADKSTYGFFGKKIDCIIIKPELGDKE